MPIAVERLTHRYDPADRRGQPALQNVSLTIADGERVGLAGATGSGKTTLAMHFNALLLASEGRVAVNGLDPQAPGLGRARRAALRHELRRQVGLVFQYPESQLFEDTVAADIAYGPRNQGVAGDALEERVARAMQAVGLPAELSTRSPFELSGGQMRRVALAGVLAMEPAILVLDEPTAGLDPGGRRTLLEMVHRWHAAGNGRRTLIYVTHSMEELANAVDRLVVLHQGAVVADDTPRGVFGMGEQLAAWGLEPPAPALLLRRLAAAGWRLQADALTFDEAFARIRDAWEERDAARDSLPEERGRP